MLRVHLAAFLLACGLAACHHADVGKSCQKDADCADGLECELEHGQGTCQAHGGSDDGSDGGTTLATDGTGSTGGDDGGTTGTPCEDDSDCPEGEECELEHSESFCKPHGGSDESGASQSGSG